MLALRHRSDPTPPLAPLAGLVVRRETRASAMAALQQRTELQMQRRLDDGHRAYVAYVNGTPAAFGWVATRSAELGELRSTFAIPNGDRYLWNFVTLASFRGLGIYPRLVDAIVRAESSQAERFWIAYAPENHASGSGIRKAGFTTLAELSFDAAGRPALRALVPGAALIASRLLGLPVAQDALTPCWRCVRAGRAAMYCAPGACRCDYQVPHERLCRLIDTPHKLGTELPMDTNSLVGGAVQGAAMAFVAIAIPRFTRHILAAGLVVAALFYVGFALEAHTSASWLALELAGVGIYGYAAVRGVRGSAWWLVAGWALHPLWDVALHHTGAGRDFAPAWYTTSCLTWDLMVASIAAIAILIGTQLTDASTRTATPMSLSPMRPSICSCTCRTATGARAA